MKAASREASHEFSDQCRHWRQRRKLSQLDLALAANVSQRHLSWLETGRSKPSRGMVVRLSEALDMPLRERNLLLQAAGFAHLYAETTLEEPAMRVVNEAIRSILDHHDPMPALVVDRFWNIRMTNRGADVMLSITGDPEALWQAVGDDGQRNLARLTVHPAGLRQYIRNWEQAAPPFVHRLRREAQAAGDPELQAFVMELVELAGAVEFPGDEPDYLTPVLPLEISAHGLDLSLFSVFSSFGTPQDVTVEELRIEAFYPSDETTRQLFNSLVPLTGSELPV